ncbi:Aste57867_12863 [Aphanomyces stellatus]|uniref:Aste57867_12863 protein n=1 Tax=Aphanomyces stellatus TaxID=120398 RepID=A0A485KXG7_9STRA|nr:hypothetical protein As57867_012815 [Aphanomyces stellatus]VFT89710.1 Aste57867_12863 [Aphanomyces stellatus]
MSGRNSLMSLRMCQDDSIVLHSGVLWKRSSKPTLLYRYNWKQRYATLTPTALQYFTAEDGHQKGSVDVSDCRTSDLEIMPTDVPPTNDGATKWLVAVNTPTRRFLMAVTSEKEMNGWSFALLALFKANEARMSGRYDDPSLASDDDNGDDSMA